MSETVWRQLEQYRMVKTLPGGLRVLIRPLTKDDKEQLIALFRDASDDDVEYFRSDVRDETLVANWVDMLDLRNVFPLVAVAEDQIIGDATLHLGKRYNRHVAWVRIYLAREYRRLGVGTLLLQCLIDVGRRMGLQQLIAEIVCNQVQAIKAFESLGFVQEYTHRDFFLHRHDDALDMNVLVLRLAEPAGKF